MRPACETYEIGSVGSLGTRLWRQTYKISTQIRMPCWGNGTFSPGDDNWRSPRSAYFLAFCVNGSKRKTDKTRPGNHWVCATALDFAVAVLVFGRTLLGPDGEKWGHTCSLVSLCFRAAFFRSSMHNGGEGVVERFRDSKGSVHPMVVSSKRSSRVSSIRLK